MEGNCCGVRGMSNGNQLSPRCLTDPNVEVAASSISCRASETGTNRPQLQRLAVG